MEVIDYLPEEAASHHTRERNALVFASEGQLLPQHQDHPARYRFALQFLSPEDQVLDCACGCGYGSAILAEKCASVVGLDLFADLIEFAQKNWGRSNIEYRQADVAAFPLPFADGHFSTIVSFETIEHIPNPKNLLREFRRVLRPGGLLLISTPQAPMGNPNHVHEFLLGELCRELEERGLPISASYVQTKDNNFLPMEMPEAGRQNFIVAGRPAKENPLYFALDAQSEIVRNLKKEMEEKTRECRLGNQRNEQLVARNEQLLARNKQLMSRIESLKTEKEKLLVEIHNLQNLKIMRWYHRWAHSWILRLLRR